MNCNHFTRFILLFTAVFLLLSIGAKAQVNVLDGYVKMGLDSNLALRQKQFQLQKALNALDEAKGLFLPNVYFQSDYTVAKGGRKIDFPVGDMLNPVYSTLNLLTQSKLFPQIENQTIQFLPNNFHDTRVRVAMPLVNAEIWYNKQLKTEAISYQQAELQVYKRELVKDIRVSYFNYVRANQVVKIYENALNILQEQKKLTETLVKNEVALPVQLQFIQAEISQNKAKLSEAQNNVKAAAAYFNFLLNRPFDAEIKLERSLLPAPTAQLSREELALLNVGIQQLNTVIDLKKAFYIPTLGVFADGGFQGFGYKFNSDQAYYLAGFSVKWNLFNGNVNKYQLKSAQIDLQSVETRKDEVERQLALQFNTAQLAYESAKSLELASAEKVAAAKAMYQIVQSRYAKGVALQIELTDAFNKQLMAEIEQQLAIEQTNIRAAELERAAASYQL